MSTETTTIETTAGDDIVENLVNRLRASKAQADAQLRPSMMQAGRAWAVNHAEYYELERVAAIDLDDYDDVDVLLQEFTAAIYDTTRPGNDQIQEISEGIIGDNLHLTLEQLSAYIEGAQLVWEEVANKL